jgi:single-strand DNA-binding protein
MANEMMVTVIGNLTADPELRFTASGAAVASFTIAQTSRRFDSNNNEWIDNDAIFMRCSAWRELGENIAETFQKGHRVIAYGRLDSRSWETKEGEKRTSLEMTVQDMGASTLFATIPKIIRVTREAAEPEPEPEPEKTTNRRSTATRNRARA